ncbi:MAG: flagellar motor protein [Bdellovibrionaceae bacterium]|nr:flagellar motor protein [Pseudobdellovibrionaceae bacterium]
MEIATLLGLIIGIGGILLGNMIEGGHTAALVQGAALMIVVSGTFGAVLVSSKAEDVKMALRLAKRAFLKQNRAKGPLLAEILDCAKLARKESVLSLEPRIPNLSNEFLRDVMRTVVDSVDQKVMTEVFHTRMTSEEERLLAGAKVWMDAGGFAPTIGIIGAVLGLIHVMSNLADTSKLGAGIAVAFVATIYGVGFANLIFIPLANKIKKIVNEDMKVREMTLQGGLGIQAGLTPSLLELKLKAFLEDEHE